MTTAAVVLAGGKGSRFTASLSGLDGRDRESRKLLVDFRGRPLAAWAVEAALRASLDAVYVVTGAIDIAPALSWLTENCPDLPLGGLIRLRNRRWAEGQATSLAAALERARSDGHRALVVGLADQPFISASTWSAVAEAPGPIAVATFERQPRPPVKLEQSIWPLVPTEGDSGARSLIRMRPDLVSEVPCVDNPVDIDTLKDLQAWN